jgi:hypothetical protein
MNTFPFSQPGASENGHGDAESAAQLVEAERERARQHDQVRARKEYHLADRKGKEAADAEGHALRTIVSTVADTITPRRVKWLWADRIPLGELTLIVGKGGIGKSTLLCTLAAWITVGDMRGEFDGEPHDVIYVANEDALDYTVVPRLIAAGADLSRVHFLRMDLAGHEDRIILPSDCDSIAEFAEKHHAVAVMLDPLSSNLRVKDGNSGSDIRPVIEAIRRMCEQAGLAAIGLGHTRKGQSRDLLEALLGSSELGNVCRSAMGVMADPDSDDGSVVLSQEKANLGRMDIPGYKYRIVNHSFATTTEMISTARLEFLGKTDLRVSDMLAEGVQADGSKTDIAEAVQWLREYLSMAPGSQRPKVMSDAHKAGIKEHTLKRAARKLKVTSQLMGHPSVAYWSLAGSAT